jgi:excinuclease ABC subunit C
VIGLLTTTSKAVQIFYAAGRVVKGVVDKVEELSPGGLIDRILEELYGDEPPLGVPKQVLVPVEPEDLATYEEWLTLMRGSRVQIRVPLRGDKRDLHETVTRNAKEEFVRHRLRRAGDHNARSRALTELQDLLALPEAPLRIECYDMAHLQGSDYVGSMVVLEDGLPNKREYRRFKIKDVPGNDDYAAMEEVLTRRLTAYPDERDRPLNEVGQRPEVLLPTQPLLSTVKGTTGCRRAKAITGLYDDPHRAAGEALRRSLHAWAVGAGRSRGSEALFMLSATHRFANTFHRELRGKRMTTSSLDGIPGLGESRKKKLVQVMGGVNAVKKASLDELKSQSFLPDAVAEAVFNKFHQTAVPSPQPSR